MKTILLITSTLASCDSSSVCTSGDVPAITIDLPTADGNPVITDLVVRGSVTSRATHVTKILVAGIPATHDGPDFSTFDVTIPFAIIQNEAAIAATPAKATLDIRVVTDCGDDPVLSDTNIMVTLRDVSSFTLTGGGTLLGNAPGMSAELQLTSNAEAAGTAVTYAASQGTVTGPPLIEETDAGYQRVVFTPDPTKAGEVLVTASAGMMTASQMLTVVAPPVLMPTTSSITKGKSLTVFVTSSIPNDPVSNQPSRITCVANDAPFITLETTDTLPFSATMPTPLIPDAQNNLGFIIVADAAAGVQGSSVSVTCTDVEKQVAGATYTVAKDPATTTSTGPTTTTTTTSGRTPTTTTTTN